jgi:hypothetical protein
MPESLPESNSASRGHRPGFSNPFAFWKRLQADRFRREREEVGNYLRAATPIALMANRLYEDWREAVSEPIQDGQKAANLSANYWWQITDKLRRFQQLSPPKPAQKYHRLFLGALQNGSEGAEVVKNGFRFNKYVDISRGMGYLDTYVELMAAAEGELRRLVERYRLVDGGEKGGGEG